MINRGILDSLVFEQREISKGLLLLQSVICNESEVCTKLAYKIYNELPDIRANMQTIFYKDWNKDCESFFDLRIDYYKDFGDSISIYTDFEAVLKGNNSNFSRLIELIKIGVIHNLNVDFHYREYLELQILISFEQLEDLIKIIPQTLNRYVDREWIATPHNMSYKRLLVELIKSSLVDFCCNKEMLAWRLVNRLIGQDNFVYNEIILFAYMYLSNVYSNKIFEYFCLDLNNNIFEYSSTKESCLDMFKSVVIKHSPYVNTQILNHFLLQVVKYRDKCHIKYQHELRLKNIKKSNFNPYNSYWGGFQCIVFNSIDSQLLEDEYKAVKAMLNRKYPKGISLYNKTRMTSGFVNSSISFDKLSEKAWIKLLCDKLIDDKQCNRISKQGLLIENSTSTIINAVAKQIEDHTRQFLMLMISCGSYINSKYIEAAVIKLADEQILSKISDVALIEFIKYILSIDIDMRVYVPYIFDIIAKRPKLYVDNEVRSFINNFFNEEIINEIFNSNTDLINTSDGFLM